MLSLVDTPCPDLPPASFNMAAYVLRHAQKTPDKIALAVLGGALGKPDAIWTYRELEAAVLGAATLFRQHGAQAGDKILMRLGNTVDFPIAYLAALSQGMVPVPTSAMLTAREINKIATEIEPMLIIAGPDIACPDTTDATRIDQRAFEAGFTLPPAPYDMGPPERLAYIIYTSGTSGNPRAVCHAHHAIWARRMMYDGWYGITANDRMFHAGAFNWTYTLGTGLMDPWSVGATALIARDGTPAQALSALLSKHEATIFAAAPGVYRQILKHDIHPKPCLRHGLSAGEKMPESLRQAWNDATGTHIYEAYGMSECSTFISGSPARPAPKGSSGYPQTGRRIAIVDDTGTPVSRGKEGSIAISNRDLGLMIGYLGQDVETKARFRGEWFLTGDMATMMDDGAISYLGRDDDMMNAGGFRVSPVEVETVLNHHPEIQEAAAVEVEVKKDTTVIAAFYVADHTLEREALFAYTASRLARYKQPRLYVRIDALPKGGNNKLLRRELRETYEADHG